MIQQIIKANQRRMELDRRSISGLKSGRGRVWSGRVEVTAECIANFVDYNASYLEANRILRKHQRNAQRP